MVFNVYDPHGYKLPFQPYEEWRNVERRLPVQPPKKHTREQQEEPKKETKAELKRPPFFALPDRPKEGKAIVAEQIMHRAVITVLADDTIDHAWETFIHRRLRHIPVVSAEKRLIGIISDRDVARYMFENEKKPASVGDIMVSPVLTARPKTEIAHIARVLIDEHVGALPIVDETDALVGIVTRTDLLRTIARVPAFDIRV